MKRCSKCGRMLDESESPRTGDRIIVIDEDYHIVDVGYFGNSDRILDGHRWAYIDDLLPSRKEGLVQ